MMPGTTRGILTVFVVVKVRVCFASRWRRIVSMGRSKRAMLCSTYASLWNLESWSCEGVVQAAVLLTRWRGDVIRV
jgi:hypothetical protein